MKKFHFLKHPVVIFVLAQLAWLSLVGIWIYWYISNYIIFDLVGDKVSPQLVSKSINLFVLITGLFLLVAVLTGMYLIFIYLNKQLHLTKLYDNFIGNVTHELKSPLASIQLYLETMNIRDVTGAKQKEFIALMRKDANRLNYLINSLLQISGLEQKKIAHSFDIYSLEPLVRNLISESARQFNIPDDAIKITGTAPCSCVLDTNAIKIVIDNLIDNAIKYSKETVQLKIQLACNSKSFVIQFIDQGVGISPKDRKEVFKKFHRIYNPDSPNVKGTGLGLYWVKEIIKYHGGKISVFSEGRNKGSTFKIELPIYQTTKKRYINSLLKISTKNVKNDG
ncbi:two-component sensor histidine kinase [candidate division KSB1 bacterium 4572_119]|nr:MAG: two-component sensor histidine kinase [candidate division KSB1 bacterium 4572_119]